MKRVLFVRGLSDTNELHAEMRGGQLCYVISGCSNVYETMQSKFSTGHLLLLGHAADQPLRYSQLPDLIFNEISEPDTHDISLSRAEQFCDHLPSVPVINPPELIRRTTRDQVSTRLQGRPGLIVPRTIRCRLTAPEQVSRAAADHNLPYPLIVRVAGAHGGKLAVKVDSASDFSPLHALPMDGRTFYITEFFDFRNDDGIYEKWRIAVVQGKPFLRHIIMNDGWLVNATTGRAFLLANEAALERKKRRAAEFDDQVVPKIERPIQEIYDAIQLDYFGIDCHITENDELVLFEANANMNILISTSHEPSIQEVNIERICRAIELLIRAKSEGGNVGS